MKIPLTIDINGDLCGYDCPFRIIGLKRNAGCHLFKENLDENESYGSVDGFKRCRPCMQLGTDEKKGELKCPNI